MAALRAGRGRARGIPAPGAPAGGASRGAPAHREREEQECEQAGIEQRVGDEHGRARSEGQCADRCARCRSKLDATDECHRRRSRGAIAVPFALKGRERQTGRESEDDGRVARGAPCGCAPRRERCDVPSRIRNGDRRGDEDLSSGSAMVVDTPGAWRVVTVLDLEGDRSVGTPLCRKQPRHGDVGHDGARQDEDEQREQTLHGEEAAFGFGARPVFNQAPRRRSPRQENHR